MTAPVVLADLYERAARVESQAAVVDRRLRHPARWEGPDVVRRAVGEPATMGWAVITEAYNRIADDPGRALTSDGFAALAGYLAGRSPALTDNANGVLPRLAPALTALAIAADSTEPAPLRAARLDWAARTTHGLPRSLGWALRLAGCAVLLRAGWRSTLVACLVDDLGGSNLCTGSLPRGQPRDEEAYLRAALHAMALRTDAVARYRRRDEALRAALRDHGIPASAHDDLVVRFDTLRAGEAPPDPALRALCAVSAPWPLLSQEWGAAADRLGPQLERLRAEEAAQGRLSGTRCPVSPPGATRRPVASVIVPAYADAATIADVLEGLERQDFAEPYEVIVVASGNDDTPGIVRRQFPRTALSQTTGRLTPGGARNRGLTMARGDVITFVAADCVPGPDWLSRRVEAHRRGHALVGGFVDCATPSTVAGWAQYFAKFWGMQALHQTRGLGSGPLYHLSYARTVLFRSWDETSVAGEDTDFNDSLVRAGYQVWFDARIRVFHVNARGLRTVLREQREQGEASGRLAAQKDLDRYFGPLAGGPMMPVVLGWRCIATVARARPTLLLRAIAVLPLTVAAIAARRRGFRRGRDAEQSKAMATPSAPFIAPPPTPAPAQAPGRAVTARPRISVVVPAYNEQGVIGPCLDSLLGQTGPPLEIIVVDDGSRDRTAERAAARPVRLERTPHRGPAAAKNTGAAVAEGEVLVFFDADLLAAPGALAALCTPILDGAAVGTYTADMWVANPENGWADCWTLNRGARRGEHFAAPPPPRWANFRAVRRDLFVQAGGFDDVGYGEDMTLAPKLGAEAVRVDGARLWHHHPSSLREIWGNARWIGRGPVTRQRARPLRYRDLPRSFRRGVVGARRLGRPRFVLFALVYDVGILSGSRSARRTRGREGHAKGHAQ